MKKPTCFILCFLCAGVAFPLTALGQTLIELEFNNDGVLPSAQGFTFIANPDTITEAEIANVADGQLTIDTTDFGTFEPVAAYYHSADAYDHNLGLLLEFRARAQGHPVMVIQFSDDTFVGSLLLQSGLWYIQGGPSGTLPPFSPDGFHVYRFAVAAGTGAYDLFVDDFKVASGTLPAAPTGNPSSFIFGDTAPDNASVEFDYIHYVNALAVLSVNDIAIAEGTNGVRQAVFTVSLAGAPTQTATVDYATEDGTALAGEDYVAASGTLTFEAGQSAKQVAIDITADMPIEPEETFTLRLSNASNATILKEAGICTITQVHISQIRIDAVVTFNTIAGRHYRLDYSDDMATWEVVPGADSVEGNGGDLSVSHIGGGGHTGRFYRPMLLD